MTDFLVAVTLFVHEGCEREFRAFEEDALGVVVKRGGQLVRAMNLAPHAEGLARPYEFHLLAFASAAAFNAYKQSPDALALAPRRSAVIARTDVITGTDISASVFPSTLRS